MQVMRTQGSIMGRFVFLRQPRCWGENGLGVDKNEAGKPTERHPVYSGALEKWGIGEGYLGEI